MSKEPRNHEESQNILCKRIGKIADRMKSLGYEETGDRSDGRIHFEKRTDVSHGKCSFGLRKMAHQTDGEFEAGLKEFFDIFSRGEKA